MTGTGIHDITQRDYHADKITDVPTLSASIAACLINQSPRHAWTQHPKLNPDYRDEQKDAFDLGTIVHQLLLEGHTDSLVAVDAADWRSKAAQEERDAAYAAGLTPILVKHLPRIKEMVDAAARQLAEHHADPPLLSDGKPEQCLVWEEPGGVVCRSLVDWLRDDIAAIDDVKTTSRSADPERFTRNLYGLGYDLKAAFYLRGVKQLTGLEPEFRWIAIETSPPYALSVVSPGPDVLAVAADKVVAAIERWRDCLERDYWPAYPLEVCYAELPSWEEARWLARRDEDLEEVRAA